MKFFSMYLIVQIGVAMLHHTLSVTALVYGDNVGKHVDWTTKGRVDTFHPHRSLSSCKPTTGTISTGNFRTSICKSMLTVKILKIRGGNINDGCEGSTSSTNIMSSPPIFDMDRMKIRLDGLGQYAVICALLLNVCLNIYFNTMKYLDVPPQNSINNSIPGTVHPRSTPTDSTQHLAKFYVQGMKIVKVIFILSSIFSIMSSAYTTVVFTLLGVYSKAALGMGCDRKFLQFFDETQKLRESAFDAFVISLVNFELSFLSSLMIAYKGEYRRFVIVITALCLTFSLYHWVSIITFASRLLYSSSTPTSLVS